MADERTDRGAYTVRLFVCPVVMKKMQTPFACVLDTVFVAPTGSLVRFFSRFSVR